MNVPAPEANEEQAAAVAATPTLRRVTIEGLPDDTFILESAAVERLLFGRELVGARFERECLSASTDFCQALYTRLDNFDISELLILNGGRFYSLSSAYRRLFGRELRVNELKAARRHQSGGVWSAEISYSKYKYKTASLVVGDTVATGVSARVALEDFFAYHVPRQVTFFSICGSISGARVIAETCARYGVTLAFVFGLAAFGLADNGTDLPFLHPDTVTRSRYLDRATQVYGGKPVCAIGDWGERGLDPDAYLAGWADTKRRWGLP